MREFEVVLCRDLVSVEVYNESYNGEITESKVLECVDRIGYMNDSYITDFVLNSLTIEISNTYNGLSLTFRNPLISSTGLKVQFMNDGTIYSSWI